MNWKEIFGGVLFVIGAGGVIAGLVWIILSAFHSQLHTIYSLIFSFVSYLIAIIGYVLMGDLK